MQKKTLRNKIMASINILKHITLLAFNRNNTNAYYEIGCSLEYLRQYTIAIKYLTIAIQNGISNYDVFFRRGCCYDFNKNRNLQASLSDYKKATIIDHSNAEIYYNIGNIYFDLHDYENAKEMYLINIKLSNTDPKPYIGLGYTFFLENNIVKAIQYYKQGISIEPFYKKYIPEELDKYFN